MLIMARPRLPTIARPTTQAIAYHGDAKQFAQNPARCGTTRHRQPAANPPTTAQAQITNISGVSFSTRSTIRTLRQKGGEGGEG